MSSVAEEVCGLSSSSMYISNVGGAFQLKTSKMSLPFLRTTVVTSDLSPTNITLAKQRWAQSEKLKNHTIHINLWSSHCPKKCCMWNNHHPKKSLLLMMKFLFRLNSFSFLLQFCNFAWALGITLKSSLKSWTSLFSCRIN